MRTASDQRPCGQKDVAGDRKDEKRQDADRHAGKAVEAEPVETGIAEFGAATEIVVGQAVGHQQRNAAGHVQNAEGRNEGRYAQIGDQDTVDRTDDGTQQAGQTTTTQTEG